MAADGAAVPQEGAAAEGQDLPNLGEVPTPPDPQAKVDAAQAEVNGEGHRLHWGVNEDDEGLELTLPPKLRLSVVGRASVVREDDVEEIFQLIEAVVGREQYTLVMNELDKQEVTADNEDSAASLGRLLNDALGLYGTSPGESPASPNS